MSTAVRAIIIKDDQILVMRRNKQTSDYYTLVGGVVKDAESAEQGLAREVKEETGLVILSSRLVFIEEHPAPYNRQLIFICDVAPQQSVSIQEFTDEALLNKLDFNTHEPMWVKLTNFSHLPFRTPQLQLAISRAISDGFPQQPVNL